MGTTNARGKAIRDYIISNVQSHPDDIAKVTAERFGITRQAVSRHLRSLVDDGVLDSEGATRSRRYSLSSKIEWSGIYQIDGALTEDRVWRTDIRPRLAPLPENVMDIWQYGFTEMFNNAIEHSDGTQIVVKLNRDAVAANVSVHDDGVGIFRKIKEELGLEDERHAVLELGKGKLTTDPKRHSGEGIFFTSRVFDEFRIVSGEVSFSHEFGEEDDWISQAERPRSDTFKTSVSMRLGNQASQTLTGVFDEFASGDDLGFTKTVVPVRMAEYGDDKLVSRSQARRLLTRFDRFKTVVLDFRGVDSIGQPFADEVFRVFPNDHPDIQLTEINANPPVRRMIERVRAST